MFQDHEENGRFSFVLGVLRNDVAGRFRSVSKFTVYSRSRTCIIIDRLFLMKAICSLPELAQAIIGLHTFHIARFWVLLQNDAIFQLDLNTFEYFKEKKISKLNADNIKKFCLWWQNVLEQFDLISLNSVLNP